MDSRNKVKELVLNGNFSKYNRISLWEIVHAVFFDALKQRICFAFMKRSLLSNIQNIFRSIVPAASNATQFRCQCQIDFCCRFLWIIIQSFYKNQSIVAEYITDRAIASDKLIWWYIINGCVIIHFHWYFHWNFHSRHKCFLVNKSQFTMGHLCVICKWLDVWLPMEINASS